MKKIIAYIGVIGAGKSFSAKNYKKKLESQGKKVEIMSFADAIREMLWKLLKWEPKSNKEYDQFKKSDIKFDNVSLTGRELLQRFGTDIMRDMVDKDIWLKQFIKKVNNSEADYILCTDCRFENEVKLLMSHNTEFIFCNYESWRYEITDHESEKFAKKCIDKFRDQEIMNYESIKTILNTI